MLKKTPGYQVVNKWLSVHNKLPFSFQEKVWESYLNGKSGLLNAPTGSGKTYALFLAELIDWINKNPKVWQDKNKNGLQLLWITPLRALAKDLQRAMQEVCDELSMQWQIGMWTGDVSAAQKAKHKKQMPEVLIITPESLHLLLGQKDNSQIFNNLNAIVTDEWHELLGSKRGVQTELALSRLKGIALAKNKILKIWGISATIGNMEEALQVILGLQNYADGEIIKADLNKEIIIESILPDEIERFPWAGHLGINLLDKVIPIIDKSKTTLLFINTRRMAEVWYHAVLDKYPHLAGSIALHHGSMDIELRNWVEEALHDGILKVVVCTSSLDLGIDFRPVDTVIQVGSPKGVARFLQRAGRSGHQPGAVSKIYFLPTHSLELMEAAALKEAVNLGIVEQRTPFINSFDVLIQYITTLAIGEGFRPDIIYNEVKSTFAFQFMTDSEWQEVLSFVTTGGDSLDSYDEFRKVEIENGVFIVKNKRIAMRHRMNIGTIVSDAMMRVKYMTGGFIGMIEEWFISKLTPGDIFGLAGRVLEFVLIKDMTVMVRLSKAKNVMIPSWLGGRIPLSSNLGEVLRHTYNEAAFGEEAKSDKVELMALKPLFDLQAQMSAVPKENELLIESIQTKDGYHLFIYPFEGRLVHEVMGALLAYRISKILPISFSIAMNDYGFELLADQPIPLDKNNLKELFSTENLLADLQHSVNSTEMAKRKFRDIAVIAGLVFQGMPGKKLNNKHLQSSSGIMFKVFSEYEKDNILLRQAYQEVYVYQIEEHRLRAALTRIHNSKILFKESQKFTPLSFPIKVDSLRQNLTSEKLEDRVKKMQLILERDIKVAKNIKTKKEAL